MITKTLITTKGLRAYSTRSLRRKKSLRNDGDELRRQMLSGVTRAHRNVMSILSLGQGETLT